MSTDRKPLSTTDSLGLVTLIAVLISAAIPSLPLKFREAEFVACLVAACFFVRRSHWTHKWNTYSQATAIVVVLVVFFVAGIAEWRNEHPRIAFQYGGKALDKQTVTLSESCPQVQIQLLTNMCTDSNSPNNFNIVAIKMVSDKLVPLHEARLYFSPGVIMPSGVYTSWQQLNQEGTMYGYEYPPFTLPAGQSLDVPQFIGTPLPTPQTRVTLTVTYGDSMTSKAEFTLRAPESSTSDDRR